MPTFPGMAIDDSYAAIPHRVAHAHEHQGIEEVVESSEHFTVRGHLHLEEGKSLPEKAGDADVFTDLRLSPFTNCMDEAATGTAQDVAARLNVAKLASLNLTGEGVAIAIFDTGISLPSLTTSLGRTPTFDALATWRTLHDSRDPGTWPAGHGTMCAFDALIAAPRATLVDFPILEATNLPGGGQFYGFVSSAMMAYGSLLASRAHGPLKQYLAVVASNSWGIFHPNADFPSGHPGRFCDNPNHPLNLQVAAATRAGIDVLFAAGNCGAGCPHVNCQSRTQGSIMGCNAVPEVLTIGGCDVLGVRAGFSSQGPPIAGMGLQKPDLMAYTHFLGVALPPFAKPDTGTSAACPVAAGCVAAIRSSPKASPMNLPPAALFDRLRKTALKPADHPSDTPNDDYGWGIISPSDAAKDLDL